MKTTNNPNTANKFNIHLLDKYMLNDENMDRISRSGYVDMSFLRKQAASSVRKTKPPVRVPAPAPANASIPSQAVEESPIMFTPHEQDTLFWSFYILKNGMDAYQLLPHRNIVVEKSMKIEYIEKFRMNKGVLKEHKCGPLSHIENALLNERTIDMKTFEALCVLENVCCMFVFNKCFYEVNIDEDDVGNASIGMVVKQYHPEKYGFFATCDVSLVRNTRYKVDNLSKPLRAMTSYKLDELVDFCKKLDISIDGPSRKKNLYEELVKTIYS